MSEAVFSYVSVGRRIAANKKETTMNTTIDHHNWIGSEQNRGTAFAPLAGVVTALLALWLSMGLV